MRTVAGSVRVVDYPIHAFQYLGRMFRGKCPLQPDLPFRFLLILKTRPKHIPIIQKSSVQTCQMQRIHKKLSLSVSTVRQLDFGLDLPGIRINGWRHKDLKRDLLPESQLIQGISQIFRTNFQGCLGKINIIRINQRIFHCHRLISMQRRHIKVSPGGVLLPGQPHISKILRRIQRSRFQPDCRNDRFDGRSRTPGLPEPVV